MPCILKIKIIQARDLPVMDKASELTDAYVEVRFADYEPQKTQINRKTLNPIWNEDFRFEVTDDSLLQNEPLMLICLDYDTITANDAVGSVILDLNPLLNDGGGQNGISGWFPLFDSVRGVRGELNIQVRLQFFGDVNPFKDSSAGVQFFASSCIPSCYQLASISGFVDALINEDDPEYHWADYVRTPRSSNDARTKLLFRMSGQLRRQIGRKVLELGANAVVGFQQSFDLENEERAITARATGTACRLIKVETSNSQMASASPLKSPRIVQSPRIDGSVSSASSIEITQYSASTSPAFTPSLHRRNQRNRIIEQPVQLITLSAFPVNFIHGIGGIVTAKSVKLLGVDDVEVRDQWWQEIRDEIKSHAKALNCQYVVGYTESTTINDELIVLSAVGTAANLDLGLAERSDISSCSSLSRHNTIPADGTPESQADPASCRSQSIVEILAKKRKSRAKKISGCRLCHLPYSRSSTPFPMSFVKCGRCKKKYVPEILLCTIEPPSQLDVVGEGCFIEAHVCRAKKKRDGEPNASIVSDAIPFTEFDIHRQLMYKLRLHGMNSLFGLKFKMTVGEDLIVCVASGTALFLSALPPPQPLRISRNLNVIDEEDKHLVEIQQKIQELSEINRSNLEKVKDSLNNATSINMIGAAEGVNAIGQESSAADTDGDSESDSSSVSDDDVERNESRTNVVVQIDDDADEDLLKVLDPYIIPNDFYLCNTESFPMFNSVMKLHSTSYDSQIITAVKNIPTLPITRSNHPNAKLVELYRELYEELYFRLSYFNPCILAGVACDIQVLDNDIQLRLTGVALGRVDRGITQSNSIRSSRNSLQSPLSKINQMAAPRPNATHITDEQLKSMEEVIQEAMVFEMDDDAADPINTTFQSAADATISARRPLTPSISDAISTRTDSLPQPLPTPSHIDITPLSFVPGTQVGQYFGKISLHFVKETHLVHEKEMGYFIHVFLSEILAVVRAHVYAYGGNALVGFRLDQTIFHQDIKNQAYGMVSMTGDVCKLQAIDSLYEM
ncbi:hypothetical protein BKA69DRAFT_1048633 [Paraphysoderma sedebokerense]|nr:hypothetical protein BKA69DRAFT_1048633 [Paraphysoderma sedebokerense]